LADSPGADGSRTCRLSLRTAACGVRARFQEADPKPSLVEAPFVSGALAAICDGP